MMKPKVIFIATVQSHIVAFHLPYLEAWHRQGYEVHVATNQKNKTEKSENAKKNHEYIIWHQIDFQRNPLALDNWKAYRQLENLMRKETYLLMHLHTPTASLISRLVARNFPTTKVVYTAHGFHFYQGAPWKNWLIYYPIEKYLARYTDAIITMNAEDYQIAKAKFTTRTKAGVYHVNGVGIDLSYYHSQLDNVATLRQNLGLAMEDFVIAVVAELIPRKNHWQIIQAIQAMHAEYPDIKVLIVGKGELAERYQKEVEKLQLQKNLIFLGYRQDIPEILQLSDCVGLFSIQEGLPRNVMEAMAMGKPLIVTNIRGCIDLVEDEKQGYVVGVHDIEATTQALKKMYHHRDRSDLGQNSKIKIKNYQIENVLEQVNTIYQNVL